MRSFKMIFIYLAVICGCSSAKSLLGLNSDGESNRPIDNPFVGYQAAQEPVSRNYVFRSKKNGKALELEIPGQDPTITDVVLPFGAEAQGRSPASTSSNIPFDSSYENRKPSLTDREITQNMPRQSGTEDWKRQEIETDLGLRAAEDSTPQRDYSYLAGTDKVKQLYRNGRFEAALLELDQLIVQYPTDSRLYEMRGSLLSKLGYEELAFKAWSQALQFDPQNESLQKFIETHSRARRPAAQ